jgi:hypothetical protein
MIRRLIQDIHRRLREGDRGQGTRILSSERRDLESRIARLKVETGGTCDAHLSRHVAGGAAAGAQPVGGELVAKDR